MCWNKIRVKPVQGSGCRAVNESKKQTTTIQQGKGCKKNVVSGQ